MQSGYKHNNNNNNKQEKDRDTNPEYRKLEAIIHLNDIRETVFMCPGLQVWRCDRQACLTRKDELSCTALYSLGREV